MKRSIFLVLYLLLSPLIKLISKIGGKNKTLNLDSQLVVLETFYELDHFIGEFILKCLKLNSSNLKSIILSKSFKFSNNSVLRAMNLHSKSRFKMIALLKIIKESFTFSLFSVGPSIKSVLDFKNITLDNFRIGKEIISKSTTQKNFHTRNSLTFGTRFNLFFLLFSEVLIYKLSKQFFFNNRPEIIVVNELYWFPWASFIRAAIQFDITCLQYVGCQEFNAVYFRKINESNFYKHPTDINIIEYKNFLDSGNIKNLDINLYISNLYNKSNWFFRNQKKKLSKENSNLYIHKLQLTSHKKIVIGIFPHIFWDAASIYGEDLFTNYYDWFLELLNYISSDQSANIIWIIKLHPDLVFKAFNSNQTKKINKYLKKLERQQENLKIIWPTDEVRTDHLLKTLDYCLTVRGTVGIEASVNGIPTITCGTGRYSNRNFTIDPSSISEYFETLDSIKKNIELPSIDLKAARAYAKVIFIGLPFRFKSQVFDPNISGLNPVDNALTLISEEELIEFRNWYNSDKINYETDPSKIFKS